MSKKRKVENESFNSVCFSLCIAKGNENAELELGRVDTNKMH